MGAEEKLKQDAEKYGLTENEKDYIKLDLPSKGILYPKETMVRIRTMKVKDERIIADMTPDNFEQKLQHLMRQVIKGINPDMMTIGDRTYCLCWLRINSYTQKYNVELVCPLCDKKVNYTFDLSKLNVKDLPPDFTEPIKVDLPLAGVSVEVNIARVADELSIINYARDSKINEYVVRYASTLVGEQFKKMADKVQFCMDLNVKDFALIKSVNDDLGNHGPEFKQDFTCPECGGYETDFGLPFRLEFLLPKSSSLGSAQGKV